MKALNKTITKSLLGLFLASCAISASAQTATTASTPTKGSFTVGADVVSSYVWRGIQQGSNEPNIQPTASFTYGGLTIGAWGSGNFSGSLKEFDLSATYAINDLFSIGVSDYDWTFTSGKSYFQYGKDSTDHLFEGTISYAGVKSFPLSASVNTIFYSAIDKNLKGDNAYSTYVELGYPLASNAKLFLGASLFDSPSIYTYGKEKGFSVINVGVKISRNIKITDAFSLPVYGVVGFNPEAENAYFVGGITF